MRLVRLVSALMLVACGDGKSPQQQPLPDGPRPDTNMPDPDGPDPDGPQPDGPVKPAEARIWAVGDILANNANIAGGFAPDATFPFNTATPPTIVVPGGGTAKLGTGDNVFDARGSKIAYIADQTVTGRFDLYVADADGSNSIVVIEGGVANIEITSLALSPDGTKIAFTMDSAAVNNGLDLYVAPTTANATPVQVSPARANGSLDTQDIFTQYEWSSDSKFVGFSGDLTENGFEQAYVTDTTAATPVPVELLARAEITTTNPADRGVRGRVQFDSANNAYFRAHLTDADANFTLFKADPVTGQKTAVALPARGDASASDAGAFGFTPDGNTLVFSADAPTLGIYDMYTAPIANLATTTKITSIAAIGTAELNAQFTAPFAFSPDATKVAVLATFFTGGDGTFEPVVIALDGSSTTRLTEVPTNTNQDVDKVVWADNATVFVTGDIVTSNVTQLYKLDAAMASQTPTLAVEMPTGGDLFNVFAIQAQ